MDTKGQRYAAWPSKLTRAQEAQPGPLPPGRKLQRSAQPQRAGIFSHTSVSAGGRCTGSRPRALHMGVGEKPHLTRSSRGRASGNACAGTVRALSERSSCRHANRFRCAIRPRRESPCTLIWQTVDTRAEDVRGGSVDSIS